MRLCRHPADDRKPGQPLLLYGWSQPEGNDWTKQPGFQERTWASITGMISDLGYEQIARLLVWRCIALIASSMSFGMLWTTDTNEDGQGEEELLLTDKNILPFPEQKVFEGTFTPGETWPRPSQKAIAFRGIIDPRSIHSPIHGAACVASAGRKVSISYLIVDCPRPIVFQNIFSHYMSFVCVRPK